ncbi:hypothetical protein [Zhongshania marina]|uniref:Uncharacterized protein n=1 Tax=Zhongshania marina TaxID=2304603 RepID=A0A2S4HG75_9GAMM|nr:hypothetical protein [Marortus luteolus]POP52983.1 hypothetical protein C0068_07765 [Marortus luteolus]
MSKIQEPPHKLSGNWIKDLDGRTELAQTMRANYLEMTNHLGGDGVLSYSQRALVEQALWLQYWLRQENAKMANGGEYDVGKVTAASNSLQGILMKLGLRKQARDVSLKDLVDRVAQ